jgi:hypothetical protein
MDTFATVAPAAIADLHMDPPEPGPALGDGMLLGELDAAAVEVWLEAVDPGPHSPLVSVEIRHNGGALSRPAPSGGALDSLPGGYLQFAVGIVPEPGARQPLLDRFAKLEAAMEPWGAGRYRSFSMSPIEAGQAFSPETVARLQAAKAKHDPDGVFLANHPVT